MDNKNMCKHSNKKIIKESGTKHKKYENKFFCIDCNTLYIDIEQHEHDWEFSAKQEDGMIYAICKHCSSMEIFEPQLLK